MAKEKRVYEGVPAGAVFEASQKAVRSVGLEIDAEDMTRLQIFAERKKTIWNEALEVTLSMSEVGNATELRLSTEPEGFIDSDGKDIASRILNLVGNELEKIRKEGRISTVTAPKSYTFGQNVAPSVASQVPTARSTRKKEAAEKKKASGGVGFGIPILIGLYWLFMTDSGEDFLSSLSSSVPAGGDISSYDCDRLARYFEGRSVQNLFGAQSRVLEITNLTEIVKSADRVRCNATATLSNGRTQRVRLQVYKSESGRTLFEINSL